MRHFCFPLVKMLAFLHTYSESCDDCKPSLQYVLIHFIEAKIAQILWGKNGSKTSRSNFKCQ